jgi:hypothetical protein
MAATWMLIVIGIDDRAATENNNDTYGCLVYYIYSKPCLVFKITSLHTQTKHQMKMSF